MILVYGLTVIITGAWLLKTISDKRLTINRTPLDIPLLLFLVANILSTIFSIDQHTSIWGYYSRSNGGLLSIISYLLLYFSFVSNISKVQVFKILKVGLVAGVIISIWGIMEHFGISLSCVILKQELNAGCWVQDVQARVFATLGQPNWLASYLAMLIFPCLYFVLTSKTRSETIRYTLYTITYYLAFTFTYSRGPTLGLIIGFIIFVAAFLTNFKFKILNLKKIAFVLLVFLLINLLFGSALTTFRLVSKFAAPVRPSVTINTPSSTTQLEAGGTESGQIRLIVWQGAIDIFRHYPILGTGVETFAYSYYQYRPVTHNLVSEWDFLYNKAHNEFLNYLANTGIVGFGTYIFLISTFILWCITKIFNFQFLIFNENLKLKTSNFETTQTESLLIALLASYISYLVSNFFGFSVVITALFFFLLPAIAFVATDSLKVYRFQVVGQRWVKAIILVSTFYLLFSIFKLWYADTIFAIGQRASESGNTGKAYDFLSTTVSLRKDEPFYLSEESNVAAGSALALKDVDASLSATLKELAIAETEQVLMKHPKNTSFWRTAIRTYYDLSLLDESLNDKLLKTFDQTIRLAPTDPKLLYNKAIVLGTLDEETSHPSGTRNDEAIEILKRAIELKPNYLDAYYALGLFFFDGDKIEEAVVTMRNALKIAPTDTDTIDKLNEWGKEGIATQSANP